MSMKSSRGYAEKNARFRESEINPTRRETGVMYVIENWSGREDLNLRPPAPHAGALPGCATPRVVAVWLPRRRVMLIQSAGLAKRFRRVATAVHPQSHPPAP
ncbi:hypothetical protein BN874_610045 [Candidatus Contendobacter odensis Run_B_J11]|uniref:Uncharacterized protein n=1 Tax=Candidatus Contendobacter odensis Run_B_J11 TaxID=1400861 RepID=A0A7U7GEK4_9GAMM|nr:hypothetical protein BN874_610045 [Candidatus Contendobacter odensis Run_B_J11]